jgi:outer membrane lipoprotein-sorting protein
LKRFVVYAILASLLISSALSASPSADSLLDLARKRFAQIRDYSVDIELDVKGESIAVKGMTMTMYYKKPDKTKLVAKQGFSAMPREIVLGDVIDQLAKNCVPVLLKTEKKNGVECYVIILQPLLGAGQPATTLWMDKSGLVRSTESGGPYPVRTDWRYAKVDEKYQLPCRIDARITAPAMSAMPRHRHGDADEAMQPQPANGTQTVRATITFSNYRVNKGIRDSVFKSDHPK